MIYQQGDILIKKISKIPEQCKKIKKGLRGYVLAEGETTGYAHIVNDRIDMFNDNDNLYVSSETEFTVKHEEHMSVTIEPGTYKISKVLEYDHFLEESREVQD